MPKQIPCLWFDGAAEEAAAHYTSIFPNSAIGEVTRYGPDMPMPEGTAMTVSFTLDGQEYVGLNGGPQFPFTEAVSFQITCETQEEVDRYWEVLTEGGEESMCGWLKDRYGLSWQVVPKELNDMLADPDKDAARRAMQSMLQMGKLEVDELRRAFRGEATSASA